MTQDAEWSSFRSSLPLEIDEHGLATLCQAFSELGEPTVVCERSDGWVYRSEDLDDALSRRHYGNHYIRAISFHLGERRVLRLADERDSTMTWSQPTNSEGFHGKVIEIAENYKSSYSWIARMPLWWIANTLVALPVFVGSTLNTFIFSPKETMQAIAQSIDGESTEVASERSGSFIVNAFEELVVVALLVSVLLSVIWPFRRIVRGWITGVSLNVSPNERRNDHAKWGRRLMYGT